MFCGCSRKQVNSILRTIIISYSCVYANAQDQNELRVYQDEYVVELTVDAGSTTSDDREFSVGFNGAKAVKKLRDPKGRVHLVKAKRSGAVMEAASSEGESSKAVPYNRSDDFCVELLKRRIARSCSPNFEVKANATPNDPQFGSLWGLSASSGIDAPGAWDLSTGAGDVVVAIIDTGVDYTHPDLASNIWVNTAEIPGNNKDDDRNGYVDDVHGMNAVNHSGNPFDDNSHGTHVSGTIGGIGNNARGVAGVNWNVKIMGLKFLNGNGSGSLAGAIEAINYMVEMKNRGVNIKVSNNSWGGGGYSQALYEAIARARDAGILFVAAAGNEGNDNDAYPAYPASYDLENVISVAAIDQNGNLAGFSNYGITQVDIAAPGVSILSTTPGNTYSSFSGTSMATPHVSGALALLESYQPTLTNSEVLSRLYESGVDMATLSGAVRTGRKLNVSRMLRNEVIPLPPTPTAPEACEYGVEEIAYAPDLSADNTPIVLQADEFNFYELSLPFAFPYHKGTTSTVYVSPNGVVYAQRAPSSMDYENGSSAPLNSIAALHSDLVAESDPQGIRVYTDSNHAVISWKVKHYAAKSSGDVEVRLVLRSTGIIEEFIAFGDSQVQSVVRGQATVGLTGPTTQSSLTYAYNSSLISNGLALKYTPLCDGSGAGPVTITDLKVRGLKKKSKEKVKKVEAGNGLNIRMLGFGTGATTLGFGFNGELCPNTASVNVTSGSALVRAIVPRMGENVRSISFVSGRSSETIKVEPRSKKSRARERRSGISESKFVEYCDQIISSVSQQGRR